MSDKTVFDKAVPDKAIVLISGGLDSTTTLAIARSQGLSCYGLSFDYGQRHRTELEYARRIAAKWVLEDHLVLKVDIGAYGGSALTDSNLEVPTGPTQGIPITYVPARNTIFLAYALGYAEVVGATRIYIGVNAVDYSGYPDCRPEFIEAFQQLANLATRTGVEGDAVVRVEAPLIHLSKTEIIQCGLDLGVDYAETVSCYQLDKQGRACAACESCLIRKTAFEELGIDDPTRY